MLAVPYSDPALLIPALYPHIPPMGFEVAGGLSGVTLAVVAEPFPVVVKATGIELTVAPVPKDSSAATTPESLTPVGSS